MSRVPRPKRPTKIEAIILSAVSAAILMAVALAGATTDIDGTTVFNHAMTQIVEHFQTHPFFDTRHSTRTPAP